MIFSWPTLPTLRPIHFDVVSRLCQSFSSAPCRECQGEGDIWFRTKGARPDDGVTPDPDPGSSPGDTAESSSCHERIQLLGLRSTRQEPSRTRVFCIQAVFHGPVVYVIGIVTLINRVRFLQLVGNRPSGSPASRASTTREARCVKCRG